MLSLSSLLARLSRIFSQPPVATVEAPMAVAAPVAAPVAPLPTFFYKVLAPSGSAVLMARSVCAVNEAAALSLIGVFQDERVQIIGGGRYRACVTNGGVYVYRPIETIDRSGAGARSNHTRNRTEKNAVVGQPTLPYYSDEVFV